MPISHPYPPPASYHMDPVFTTSYEPVGMPSLAEAPRPQELQGYYDGIAQGVKPSFQQYSPAGSPHSASHSFDNQPPVLTASSDSGASVSSSVIGSPSLHPQFAEPWSQIPSGFPLAPGIVQGTSGFEYDTMAVADKGPGFVGESTRISSAVEPFPSVACRSPEPLHPTPRSDNVFKSPTTPASAKWSVSSRHRSPSSAGPRVRRRNSLLSHEVRPCDVTTKSAHISSPSVSSSISSCASTLDSSCQFPCIFSYRLSVDFFTTILTNLARSQLDPAFR
jgi:hypothetical protein